MASAVGARPGGNFNGSSEDQRELPGLIDDGRLRVALQVVTLTSFAACWNHRRMLGWVHQYERRDRNPRS